mgnify:CR=1 FL=1
MSIVQRSYKVQVVHLGEKNCKVSQERPRKSQRLQCLLNDLSLLELVVDTVDCQ